MVAFRHGWVQAVRVLPSSWLAWAAILHIPWAGRALRQSLAPAHPMLPKHSPCPQDVEDGGSFPNNRSARSGLCKNSPGSAGPRWGLDACSKATVWEPGLPSSDLAHSCSKTTFWCQTGSMCTEGGSAACGGSRGGLPGHIDCVGLS